MAWTVVTDSFRDMSADEIGGDIMRLTRTCVVTSDGVAETPPRAGDYTDVRRVLENAGVPDRGDNLSSGTPEQQLPNLYCVSRSLIFESPLRAIVTLQYQYLNQSLSGTDAIVYWKRIASQPSQRTTQRDKEGLLFDTVEHGGSTQIPEISVYEAIVTFEADVVAVGIDAPLFDVKEWANKVNDGVWNVSGATFGPGEVLIQRVSSTPLVRRRAGESGATKYILTFVFAYDGAGWQPHSSYRDPTTGRLPAGLTSSGDREETWYEAADFSALP